jgi:hypothetical protein
MGRVVSAETDFHAYVIGIAGCAEDFEVLNEFRLDVSIPADPFLTRLHSGSHSRRILLIEAVWKQKGETECSDLPRLADLFLDDYLTVIMAALLVWPFTEITMG